MVLLLFDYTTYTVVNITYIKEVNIVYIRIHQCRLTGEMLQPGIETELILSQSEREKQTDRERERERVREMYIYIYIYIYI